MYALKNEKTGFFSYAKTKAQITAQLISAFDSIPLLPNNAKPKFQASYYHLWFHSPICVGNPEDSFSCIAAQI